MSRRSDERLRHAAVLDFDLERATLFAYDRTGAAVESGVELPLRNGGIDFEMDLLAVVELLDGALGRRCPAVAGVVFQLVARRLSWTVRTRHSCSGLHGSDT